MTKQEFFDKYGDVVVSFSSYYKYVFYYKADLPDGTLIHVSVGGNSEDIYRFDISSEDRQEIRVLDPYAGNVRREGVRIESFYDSNY